MQSTLIHCTLHTAQHSMDATLEESLLPDDPWEDNLDDVKYEFIKTGKSGGLGVLITHDGQFKV